MMRQNLPVSDTEYSIDAHQTIVSTTNLKGLISYANPYFIEASGFTAAELIGAPHNVLRHPDMPREAFADLWATIKAGKSWTGVVKNRRKNGDYYWVFANVTPVIENGHLVGYLSVRTKPSREQVRAAAALYQEMQAGNPRRLALRQGRVIRTGWKDKLAVFKEVALATRIRCALSFLLITAVGFGALAWSDTKMGQGMTAWLSFLALAQVGVIAQLWHGFETGVVAPLRQALNAAHIMAGGDLTGQIDTERTDEAGQLLRALRQMNINLNSVIGDIRNNFFQMQTATEEIASGNMDLSGRTESQASALEETASSMEQLAATVGQNAEHAFAANKMAGTASSVAQSGGEIVGQVVSTICEISESSRKIVDIIGIIDGIAFQTNILALNAAVEAARAGEQGRGFAVVAGEVRGLAQRSAAAAREIKLLIERSVKKVDAGTVLARDAGTTMESIIRSVDQVTRIMNDITEASREQNTGIGQVNQAIAQMDAVTQQNAALVEQAAAATASLSDQARILMQSLELFKLKGEQGKTPILPILYPGVTRLPWRRHTTMMPIIDMS
jgi:aerotaxis receptor